MDIALATPTTNSKEQGLTARQRERRYSRKRDSDSLTEKRKKESFVPAYSGGYPFSISGDIRSVPS